MLKERVILQVNIFIITKEDEFNKICSNYEESIDFNNKMVVFYIFSDDSTRDYRLKKLNLEDKKMTIYYKLENSNKKDAVALYQRCFWLF